MLGRFTEVDNAAHGHIGEAVYTACEEEHGAYNSAVNAEYTRVKHHKKAAICYRGKQIHMRRMAVHRPPAELYPTLYGGLVRTTRSLREFPAGNLGRLRIAGSVIYFNAQLRVKS